MGKILGIVEKRSESRGVTGFNSEVKMSERYVFMDRDGVINKDPAGWTEYSYVTNREDFHVLPGVLDGLKLFMDAGYKIIVISNQQGVAKGYFSQKELDEVTRGMKRIIKNAGSKITKVYYCTHHKEEKCACRKPQAGLFLKAKVEFKIKNFNDNFFIGDTENDMQAAKTAGLKTILVLSGKSLRKDIKTWQYKPDYIRKNLKTAAQLILKLDFNLVKS